MSGEAVRLTCAESRRAGRRVVAGLQLLLARMQVEHIAKWPGRVAIVPQVTAVTCPRRAEALDAYSRVVTFVAESVSPSVANLRVGRGAGAGGGSGVVITPDGFLLTSAHVVGGPGRVRASFTDGRELALRLVGADPLSDLACCAPTNRARARAARRRRGAARGPARRRDRQPARLRELGHGRRRLRAGPLAPDARRRHDARRRRRDPDRRGAQPRQLGRRAGRRARAASSASTRRSRASGSASRCRSTRRRRRSWRR